MSATIWKYSLAVIDGPQRCMIPAGATVLHVEMQNEFVTLWICVTPDEKPTARWFVVRGTGHPLEDDWWYLGTAHDPRGFVWHVLEMNAPESPDSEEDEE